MAIPKLLEKAKQLGMQALALSDNGNLFAAVKFYE
ncbi:MAG: PHP domain-containing protein, partial [Candidatus Thioglobus sp.]|nr:PHP domain-containing protein [Candidatus Thioglobus sp.]